MSFEAEITPLQDHLLVVSRGSFDVEYARAVFADVVRRADEAGLDRILVDNRRLERPLAATEKVLLSVSVERTYRDHLDAGGRPLRVAILVPRAWLLPYRPFADGLNAMGFEAATFCEPAEVEAWLEVALG
jgi:hypothetical protein